MKVVVAGGGSVGVAIAQDLTDRHHTVTLLEQRSDVSERIRREIPSLNVVTCDACEVSALQQVGLRDADVIVAATGDDEDNLVISWLAKQEFGVPRVIARVNNSRNEWLFDESWGVDVHVSTPALITSLVDEAVEVGAVVSLMDLAHGRMKLQVVAADGFIVEGCFYGFLQQIFILKQVFSNAETQTEWRGLADKVIIRVNAQMVPGINHT